MATSGHRPDPAKERFWRRTLKRWEKDDLTIRAFCEQERLSAASFHWWRGELKKRDQLSSRSTANRAKSRSRKRSTSQQSVLRQTASPSASASASSTSRSPSFVPVRVASETSAFAGRDVMEILLRNGRVVRICPTVDTEALSKVVAMLEGGTC